MIQSEQEAKLMEWYHDHFELSSQFFTWGMIPDINQKDTLVQYLTPTVKEINTEMKTNIDRATERIAVIFEKTYHYIMENRQLLHQLGLHPKLLEIALTKESERRFSQITRFDFLVNDNWSEFKLCEANTATPQGLVEADIVNPYMCDKYSDGFSPNKVLVSLKQMWQVFREEHDLTETDTLHFSTYDWHDEDYETARFIVSEAHPNGEVVFVPIEEMKVTSEGVYDLEGRAIKNLYILYPLEYLPYELSYENNIKIGDLLLSHIKEGHVTIINPFSATIMQTKRILPFIWKLAQDAEFFTEEERDWISSYFIPTYDWDKTKEQLKLLLDNHGPKLILKPIYGREGEGIFVITEETLDRVWNELEQKKLDWYVNQPYIVQKYIETFSMEVETWEGLKDKKVMVGSFYIAEQSAGLYLRADDDITSSTCLIVNVAVTDNSI